MQLSSLNLKNLGYSLFGNGVIVFSAYVYAQPDPKGVLFSSILILIGFLSAVFGLAFILLKYREQSFAYYFVMIANTINLIMSYRFVKSIIFNQRDLSWGILIDLVCLTGAAMGIIMLLKIINLNQNE